MLDSDYMRLALAQAAQAAECGEVPVGAVLVRHGVVLAAGHNHMVGASDPTAHAEIVVLRQAAATLGNYRLEECELFVTLEPCAMCSGALLNARIKRVVFGAFEPKTGACGSIVNLFADQRLNHQTSLQGGVLAAESASLLQQFFAKRRADKIVVASSHHPLRDDALRTPDTAFAGLNDFGWTANYQCDLPALAGLRLHYLDESLSAQDTTDLECDYGVEQGGMPSENGFQPALKNTYLCLHESQGWSYNFRRLVPLLLREGHRVVVPDLIGYGKSDKPKKAGFHTFARHRQIMLEFVAALDLQRIVLVMAQPGSLLALSLPVGAPERYVGLQCIDLVDEGSCQYLPLASGSRVVEQVRAAMLAGDLKGRGSDSHAPCQNSLSEDLLPFPDKGFTAGLRAFDLHQQFLNKAELEDVLRLIGPVCG